jgi:hypothetical protein
MTQASYASFVATALGFPLADADVLVTAHHNAPPRQYVSTLARFSAPAIAASPRFEPRLLEPASIPSIIPDRIAVPTGADASSLAAQIIAAGRKRRGEHVQEQPKDEASRLAAQIIAAGRKRRGEIE